MSPPMGFEGVALAVPLMQWTMLFVIVILIVLRKMWLRYGYGYAQSNRFEFGAKHNNNNPANSYRHVDMKEDSVRLIDESSSSKTLPEDQCTSMHGGGGGSLSHKDTSDDPEDNFPMITLSVFQGWLPILKLGMPGAVSLFIGIQFSYIIIIVWRIHLSFVYNYINLSMFVLFFLFNVALI